MPESWDAVNAWVATTLPPEAAGPEDNGFGGVPDRDELDRRRSAIRVAREAHGFDVDQRREEERQADRQARLDERNAPKSLGDRLADRRLLGAVRGLNDHLIKPASAKARRVPTPGGIGLMVIALLVFLFAIVAVNGTHTRLELIWLTLLGKTSVPRAPGDVDTSANARAAIAAAAAGVSAAGDAAGVPIPKGIASAGIGAALGIGGIKVIGG